MAAYLLDTNHISPLVTLDHPLREQIILSLHNGDTFSTCVPVVTEAYYGIGIIARATQNIAEWHRLKRRVTIHTPDIEDAEKAGALQIALRKKGWQLETVDALVATLAIRYELTLLTTDRDFDAVPHLNIENWLSL